MPSSGPGAARANRPTGIRILSITDAPGPPRHATTGLPWIVETPRLAVYVARRTSFRRRECQRGAARATFDLTRNAVRTRVRRARAAAAC